MSINTLYDYYNAKGQSLPSVGSRTALATKAGISNYTGDANQNNTLLAYLLKQDQSSTSSPVTASTPVTPSSTPATATVPTTSTAPTTTSTNNGTGITKTVTYTANNPVSADKSTLDKAYADISGLDGSIASGINSLADKQTRAYQAQADQPIDEESIRKSFRDRIQGSIDAINNTYASMLASARAKGSNNLGIGRAINARSGLLGSDFASADESNINRANQDTENAILSEKVAKINAILNEADDSATKYITDKRTEAQNATDKLMSGLMTREQRVAGNASTVAQYLYSKGVTSLDQIRPEDLTKIMSDYGIDQAHIQTALTSVINTAKKSKQESDLNDAKIANELGSNRYKVIADGSQLYDTTTGKIIENPKSNSLSMLGLDGNYSGGQVTDINDALARIAHIESGGNTNPYAVISKPSANGDRAYGKYQVMGNNIPAWTKEVLGTSMTPQEFMNNPQAQEAVAKAKMMEAYNKYGNWSDVASVWFSGRPLANNTSQDVYGTSTPSYVAKFLGGTQNTNNGIASNPVIQQYVKDINSGVSKLSDVPKDLQAVVQYARSQSGSNKMTPEEASKAQAQYDGMLQAITDAKKLANNAGQSGIRKWLGNTFVGATEFNKLKQLTNTIKTNVLVNLADPNIKKFFGPSMSNNDVQLMMSKGTPLDAEAMDSASYIAELDRLEKVLKTLKPDTGITTDTGSTGGSYQAMVHGVLYNVDANGEMTPAN